MKLFSSEQVFTQACFAMSLTSHSRKEKPLSYWFRPFHRLMKLIPQRGSVGTLWAGCVAGKFVVSGGNGTYSFQTSVEAVSAIPLNCRTETFWLKLVPYCGCLASAWQLWKLHRDHAEECFWIFVGTDLSCFLWGEKPKLFPLCAHKCSLTNPVVFSVS